MAKKARKVASRIEPIIVEVTEGKKVLIHYATVPGTRSFLGKLFVYNGELCLDHGKLGWGPLFARSLTVRVKTAKEE